MVDNFTLLEAKYSVMQHILSRRLAAYIAGLSDARHGVMEMDADGMARVEATFNIISMLGTIESDVMIRAFWLGMNPDLGDMTPAEAMRAGLYDDVLAAAKNFYSNG